jgi:hypothetical protein
MPRVSRLGSVLPDRRLPVTTFELPEPDWRPTWLRPQTRSVLGSRSGQPNLSDEERRLYVGVPLLRLLNPDTLGEEAEPFLLARPSSRFHLLTIHVDFVHDEERPFVSAWVNVTLHCPAPEAGGQPVAWSMRPQNASEVVAVSRKVTVGPGLKLSIPGIATELNPLFSTEKEETFSRHDVSMEALGEGRSDPRWNFYATASSPIRGPRALSLVIDIPASAHGTASIDIGATIRVRRLKVFRYSADLTGVPDTEVVQLAPAALRTTTYGSDGHGRRVGRCWPRR